MHHTGKSKTGGCGCSIPVSANSRGESSRHVSPITFKEEGLTQNQLKERTIHR